MNIKPNDINKGPLESQEGVLYSTPLTLSEISTLPSTTLQFFQNPKTLQGFLSPLYRPLVLSIPALQ
jgi:hypothetical protein